MGTEAVLTSTHNLYFEQKHEKYQNFLSENFHFLVVKFSIYLNRHAFVMQHFSGNINSLSGAYMIIVKIMVYLDILFFSFFFLFFFFFFFFFYFSTKNTYCGYSLELPRKMLILILFFHEIIFGEYSLEASQLLHEIIFCEYSLEASQLRHKIIFCEYSLVLMSTHKI